MRNFKDINQNDPLKRTVEKQTGQPEFSPMDPPDAFDPPNKEAVAYEEMPLFIQTLMDEHQEISKKLQFFENVLNTLQENGLVPDPEIDKGLRDFFNYLDENIVPHNLKEEKNLFPLLHERLSRKGEHSRAENPRTAVDMLEDDHIRLMQLAAVTFNFLGLAARLPDTASRAITLDAAIEQGKALVELLRLHIFREDKVVFSLASKMISTKEFQAIEKNLTKVDLNL